MGQIYSKKREVKEVATDDSAVNCEQIIDEEVEVTFNDLYKNMLLEEKQKREEQKLKSEERIRNPNTRILEIAEKINYIISSLQNAEIDKENKELYINIFRKICIKILELESDKVAITIDDIKLNLEDCMMICNCLKASDINVLKFCISGNYGIQVFTY